MKKRLSPALPDDGSYLPSICSIGYEVQDSYARRVEDPRPLHTHRAILDRLRSTGSLRATPQFSVLQRRGSLTSVTTRARARRRIFRDGFRPEYQHQARTIARGLREPPTLLSFLPRRSSRVWQIARSAQRVTSFHRSPYGIIKWRASISHATTASYVLMRQRILFNHESPRSWLLVVTRKSPRPCSIKTDWRRNAPGNLEERYWGHAADYVQAASDVAKPAADDYVVLPERHTPARVCERAWRA